MLGMVGGVKFSSKPNSQTLPPQTTPERHFSPVAAVAIWTRRRDLQSVPIHGWPAVRRTGLKNSVIRASPFTVKASKVSLLSPALGREPTAAWCDLPHHWLIQFDGLYARTYI